MTFSEYLILKKIDEKSFQSAEKEAFDDWKRLFELMHYESFTMQKKFKINLIRRKFRLID